MQAKATSATYTASSARKPRSPGGTSLAAAHPDALYRFVPPLACDEEGYPFEDNPMPEGTPTSACGAISTRPRKPASRWYRR